MIQTHEADNGDDTAEPDAQDQQDQASSNTASEEQESDEDNDHWVERRWGYEYWDEEEDYVDPFW